MLQWKVYIYGELIAEIIFIIGEVCVPSEYIYFMHVAIAKLYLFVL